MPIGAVANASQGIVHPITPQVSQPAAAPDSHNIQPGASLVLKPIDEGHKSSKASNHDNADNDSGDIEESEWLQKKYMREKRLGLNVDKYV